MFDQIRSKTKWNIHTKFVFIYVNAHNTTQRAHTRSERHTHGLVLVGRVATTSRALLPCLITKTPKASSTGFHKHVVASVRRQSCSIAEN